MKGVSHKVSCVVVAITWLGLVLVRFSMRQRGELTVGDCLPTTAGFFRKRKEVCLCSTTFVYIRQLRTQTKIAIFDILSTTTAKSGRRRPLFKLHIEYCSLVSHLGPYGRKQLRIYWIYFLQDGCAAPFSPSLLC